MVNVQKAVLINQILKQELFQNMTQRRRFMVPRDKFLEMGAKDFTQSLLNEKKLLITDTTMRDAQKSLMATRMRTKD